MKLPHMELIEWPYLHAKVYQAPSLLVLAGEPIYIYPGMRHDVRSDRQWVHLHMYNIIVSQ